MSVSIRFSAFAAVVLLGAAHLAWAQPPEPASESAEATTVYRCRLADGQESLQNQPCPPDAEQLGSEQYLRPREVAPSPPVADDGAAPEPAPEQAAAAPAVVSPRSPPTLWECVRGDGSTYESETGKPDSYWLPLSLLGLSGYPATAAVKVEDRCHPLPGDEACRRYQQRRDQLRERFFNAQPTERARITPVEERLTRALREQCGRQ